MSTETSVTYPKCGCGGTLGFATGLPVFVSFDGGDIRVEVDMNEVDDVDNPIICTDCDDAEVSDEEYNRLVTLLTYASTRMNDVGGNLRMPTDAQIARRTDFKGNPIEVVG